MSLKSEPMGKKKKRNMLAKKKTLQEVQIALFSHAKKVLTFGEGLLLIVMKLMLAMNLYKIG